MAFGAVPRVIFGVAKRAESQGGGRVFVRTKSNIGVDGGGFMYAVEQTEAMAGVSTSRIAWGEPLAGAARDILGQAETTDDAEERSGKAEAMAFLNAVLRDGPMESRIVKGRARAEGFTDKQLRSAREALSVVSKQEGSGAAHTSRWSLPSLPSGPMNAHVCPTQERAEMGIDADVGGDEGEVI